MKKSIALMTVSALAITSAAMATGDETFVVGSFELDGAQSTGTIPLDLTPNTKGVIGFTVSFDYDEPISDASWASDLRMFLTAPGGKLVDLGGFSNVQNDWDFQGSGSTLPGHYTHTSDAARWADDPQDKGTWTIELINDWTDDPNPTQWNNFTITFHKVPAPGALALLGAAGLAGARRRRR